MKKTQRTLQREDTTKEEVLHLAFELSRTSGNWASVTVKSYDLRLLVPEIWKNSRKRLVKLKASLSSKKM